MRAALAFLTMLLVPVASPPVLAKPFGLAMGDRPPALSLRRDNGDGTIVLRDVPIPYPGLASYFARYDPDAGLCSVAGATAHFDGDPTGAQARAYFERLASLLTNLYGPAHHYELDLAGPRRAGTSILQWSAELARGERFYYSFWSAGSGARMRDDIASIAVSIGAGPEAAPFVLVQFDFANYAACDEGQKALRSSGL